MHNAQKKPLDSLKEQIEQLLGDLGEEASKSPNKKANAGAVRGQQSMTGYFTPQKREWDDGGNLGDR